MMPKPKQKSSSQLRESTKSTSGATPGFTGFGPRVLRPVAAALAAAGLIFTAACAELADFDPNSNTAASSSEQATSAQVDKPQPSAPAPEEGREIGDEVRIIRAKLGELQVKGRAPKTGYERSQFGQRWKDTDRNGCDQRNDVLARDMDNVDAPKGCKVLSGTLDEPYTGRVMDFVRGPKTSNEVHIDHVVALSDAWQKGAQQLTPERREAFANDHRNLLAVEGRANIQKGDADAATWLPANKGFRCQYVAIQVNVKHAYDLWVTQAEKDAIDGILDGCGPGTISLEGDGTGTGPHAIDGVLLPGAREEAANRPAPQQPAEQPAEKPAPEAGVSPSQADGEVYYPNCAAARAAGAAPIYAGEPGYRLALDGDRDGVACE